MLLALVLVGCAKEPPHAKIFEQNVICMEETVELEKCLKGIEGIDGENFLYFFL
jgi:hypothetical protein